MELIRVDEEWPLLHKVPATPCNKQRIIPYFGRRVYLFDFVNDYLMFIVPPPSLRDPGKPSGERTPRL